MLNTIPQAASLGPQNNSDGILPENDHRFFLSNLWRKYATSEMTASLSLPIDNHRDAYRLDSVTFVYGRCLSAIFVGVAQSVCNRLIGCVLTNRTPRLRAALYSGSFQFELLSCVHTVIEVFYLIYNKKKHNTFV